MDGDLWVINGMRQMIPYGTAELRLPVPCGNRACRGWAATGQIPLRASAAWDKFPCGIEPRGTRSPAAQALAGWAPLQHKPARDRLPYGRCPQGISPPTGSFDHPIPARRGIGPVGQPVTSISS